MFIKKYEELLDKGYCDCNEMNCIDNNTPRRILNIVKNLQQENKELKKQLEELEEQNFNLREDIMLKKMAIPHEKIKDKSLYDLYDMPSYSDLSKENQELKKQLKTKHNGFMASVDESCDLAEEIQKYKEVIDKINVFLDNHDKNAGKLYYKYDNKYLLSEIKEDIRDILKEVE